MMIRLFFMICVMIGLAMPCAWAGVNDAPSPLSKVTIKAEDWVEGDMYHIRYTFTNPTDEMIDKEIGFSEISYDYHNYSYENNLGRRTQCDETLSRLTIAPHSSYTMTVSLKQPSPSVFNRLVSSTFYFKDDSCLDYSLSVNMPKSPFSLLPNVSDSGDVSLTIRNDSPTDTITELRKVLILTNLQGKQRFLLRAEPYSLAVKPSETINIPLFTLDNTTDKQSSFSSFCITMDINDIPHYFYTYTLDSNTIENSDTLVNWLTPAYSPPRTPRIHQDSVFYFDESNLYAYIQVQSRHKEPISAPNASYIFDLNYFDKNTCSQTQYFRIHLPPDFCLDSGETKYFTFKIPLPSDFYTLNLHKPLYICAPHFNLAPTFLFPPSKLSLPVPKEQYTPLTKITNRDLHFLSSNP